MREVFALGEGIGRRRIGSGVLIPQRGTANLAFIKDREPIFDLGHGFHFLGRDLPGLGQVFVHSVVVAFPGVKVSQVEMGGGRALRIEFNGFQVELLGAVPIKAIFGQAAEVIARHVLHAELIERVAGPRRVLAVVLEQCAVAVKGPFGHPEFFQMEEGFTDSQPGVEVLRLDQDRFDCVLLFGFIVVAIRGVACQMEERHDAKVDVHVVLGGGKFEHPPEAVLGLFDAARGQVSRADIVVGGRIAGVLFEECLGQLLVAVRAARFAVVLVAVSIVINGDVGNMAALGRNGAWRNIFMDAAVITDLRLVAEEARQVVRRVAVLLNIRQ